MLIQKDATCPLVGSLAATSAATVRVAKIVLFRRSRAIPAMTIPVIDFRWTERLVSLKSESEKTRHAVTMKIQVHGWVRKSATDRVNIAPYFVADGDFENISRIVRKRSPKIRVCMLTSFFPSRLSRIENSNSAGMAVVAG